MNYTFSNRIQNVKPSAIREILKMTAQYPDIIALSTGSPSDEAIPVSEIREISQYIFENMAIPALQYSVTEGYPSLRAKTKERLQTVFLSAVILMMSSSQVADSKVWKSFLKFFATRGTLCSWKVLRLLVELTQSNLKEQM